MGVPVIDLFAGPGGLGEGFSSIADDNGERFFNIKLSIEKDPHAHQTLLLRSFLRQFPINQFPQKYYEMLRENDEKKRSDLIEDLYDAFPEQYNTAKEEACKIELPFPKEKKVRTKKDKEGKQYKEEYYIGYSNREIKEIHQKIDEDIERALDGNRNFLLIGGPPCQAFSLVGRSRNQGISNEDHRVHLYKEYLRIIAKHHPAVFVMENVKGLLSANIEGEKVFDWMKKDLKNPGTIFKKLNSPKYKIFSFVNKPDEFDKKDFPIYKNNSDFLIKAERYEIPQRRHRVILLGLREDIEYQGETLSDFYDGIPEPISLRSVIGGLPKIRSVAARQLDHNKKTKRYINLADSDEIWHNYKNQFREEIQDLNVLNNCELPQNNIAVLTSSGKHFIRKKNSLDIHHTLYSWLHDPKLEGVINHESRSHLLEDLRRYYFYAIHSKIFKRFPRLSYIAENYPQIMPEHENADSGKFEDRFRVQLRNEPATTVTSHISKDGHYFIHYDHNQCRSFTVREAARVQTFPDNYYFYGTRTQQFHQVGNAVPPYLAKQLAVIVKNIFLEN